MTAPRLRALDVLAALPRTNCGDCGLPTCMAFAAQVAAGRTPVSLCPHVDPAAVAHVVPARGESPREAAEAALAERAARDRAALAGADFAEVATRLGVPLREGRLVLLCCGRAVEIDRDGGVHTSIHVNTWVLGPLLDLVLRGAGAHPVGDWVTFSELRGSRDWARFFAHRCEERLRDVADRDPDLFLTLAAVLGARALTSAERRDGRFGDDAFVLSPLPRVPVLVAFRRAEDAFASSLTVFFDRSAERNLGAASLYQLAGGITEMLSRLMTTHGAT